MKMNKILLPIITATLACSMTAYAQGDGTGQGKKGGKGKCDRELPAHVIKKFDKDGDGKLNEEERKAAREARQKMIKVNREKMLERFDADKDGKLSEYERNTRMETLQKERKERRAAILEKFDANDNGKIDEDEREGIHDWVKENYPNAFLMHHGKRGHHGAKGGHRGGRGGKKGGPRGGGQPAPNAE